MINYTLSFRLSLRRSMVGWCLRSLWFQRYIHILPMAHKKQEIYAAWNEFPYSSIWSYMTLSFFLIIWSFSWAGSGARLFRFCRLGPWQGIQSFSSIQELMSMLCLVKFLYATGPYIRYSTYRCYLAIFWTDETFAFWWECFASASCKQRQRTGCYCYRILEAKVKGE